MQDLKTLQRATGVAGEIDVVVEGRDLTDPAVVKWMRDYQARRARALRLLGRARLRPRRPVPGAVAARPVPRLATAAGDREQIRALLDAVPPYFSRAVITADRRTADLAFGVRLTSLERQQEIIGDLRERLDPPPGVTAPAGRPAGARPPRRTRRCPTRCGGGDLRRRPARRAARAAVVAGARRRGAAPGTARGCRSCRSRSPPAGRRSCCGCCGVPLNPLSAMLGALVLAISTEFAVLLSARFEAERAAGHAPAEAIRRTYRSTGAAVLASGATAIAGFAVLALSDVAHAARLRRSSRWSTSRCRCSACWSCCPRCSCSPSAGPPSAARPSRPPPWREAPGPDRRRAGAGPPRLHLLQLAPDRGARLARGRAGPRAAAPSPSRSRCRTSRAMPTCPSARARCAARTC